ncbi:uncharacterized protein At3g43530-like isoform X1 [Arabidopsis lyrata subsp. lyrata]|uniref:uncharacterized protein At3g43530-like isoform X1 n=1 Tax=Arabidopsis lyrata subsp. lyrata TaxID=81972 RepID=UPI000A29C762|nr:uncharacterized protein At3g43530-like isoform X1 [Arabidopsis lyrata subsp. lyrata]|eukprot:XP_020867822.1 uncharacterized protein At3g43530-like isoform X1 [Arabidopsis lyrata subsp. lyrata]
MSSPDKTVPYLWSKLSDWEISWFLKHPQFKHIFDRPRERFHKCKGMWSLVLRTVNMKKKQNELWFVVNGVPIRYSIREHALITGLDCRKLPDNYEEELEKKFGGDGFINKYFKEGDKISLEAVFEKLQSMEEVEGDDDRLKMAVLYFLGSVINPKKKKSAKIDSFLVNIVSDLELCKSFPWGTFTFIHCIDNIRRWIKMFKSKPKSSWTIPGFTIAIEVPFFLFFLLCCYYFILVLISNFVQILAFECIQPLKSKFRENVDHRDNGCPRMCRSKFKHTGDTGYSLDAIYEAIGTTKEILSFLVPNPEEQHLLANIFIDEEDTDSVADSWNDLLTQQNKVLFWNDLYEEDQSNREIVESTKTTKRTNNPRGKKRKGSDKELRDLRLQVGGLKKRMVAVEALCPNGARATGAKNNDDMNQEEHREHEEEDALHMTQVATLNDPSEHEEEDVDNGNYVEFEESQPQSSPFQTEEIAKLKESKKKAEKPLPPSQVVNEPFKCNLINHNGNNDVVAIGCCYPSRGFLHNVPVKPDEVVVTVSEVKIDIRLWAPVDDIAMLRNAISQFIVWQKKMVVHYEEEKSEDQIERNSNTEQQMDENGRKLTGTDEEEERVQTGSGGNGSEDVPVEKKLRVYVRKRVVFKPTAPRKRNPPRTGNPEKSIYGRQYVKTNRLTPSAYK